MDEKGKYKEAILKRFRELTGDGIIVTFLDELEPGFKLERGIMIDYPNLRLILEFSENPKARQEFLNNSIIRLAKDYLIKKSENPDITDAEMKNISERLAKLI